MKYWTIILLITGSMSCSTFANILWNEANDGLLSSDNFTPTPVGQLQPGSNTITGTVDVSPFIDPDFFTFEVPAGSTLTQIILTKYETTQNSSFFGVEAGNEISDLYGFNLMGGALIGGIDGANVGDNILDDISGSTIGNGSINGSLGPGTYSVWFQEQGGPVNYEFDFQTVPEPAYSVFSIVGFLTFVCLRKGRHA